jgi:hypothetical protein
MAAVLLTAACQTTATDPAAADGATLAVSLPAAYRDLPAPSRGTPIESGTRVALDARQQEAIVAGIARWMKDPRSAQFGSMTAARNRFGVVTVCGEVNGRNGTGRYVGMRPYIGVLLGTVAAPEFVPVGFGTSAGERAEIATLCRDSGAA